MQMHVFIHACIIIEYISLFVRILDPQKAKFMIKQKFYLYPFYPCREIPLLSFVHSHLFYKQDAPTIHFCFHFFDRIHHNSSQIKEHKNTVLSTWGTLEETDRVE